MLDRRWQQLVDALVHSPELERNGKRKSSIWKCDERRNLKSYKFGFVFVYGVYDFEMIDECVAALVCVCSS